MNVGSKSGGRGNRGRRPRGGRGQSRQSVGITENSTTQERQRLYSECSAEDQCAVCLNRLEVFAVGRCNHPVCGECSTRLRVLCKQNECPICRQDIPKVFHTQLRQRYEDIENNVFEIDKKFGICFENDEVQAAYKRLLEHRCPVCSESSEKSENGSSEKDKTFKRTFDSFRQLDKHMRIEHDRYYCELCTGYLKSFSHERRHYSRSELAMHRRKGDPDDTSHRGHPLCQYCQARFVDSDELYRHLRRDHFFCHFCDADGSNLYFNDYPGLRDHFKEEHFLCEEGDCINEQFTSAFRSEIDLKAHWLDRHRSGLSKAATRQNRTVELDFNFGRPVSTGQVVRRRGFESSYDQPDSSIRSSASEARLPDLAADFPSLESSEQPSLGATGHGSSANLAKKVASSSGKNWSSKAGRGFQDQDFPSLPGFTPSPVVTSEPKKPQQKQAAVVKKTVQREPDFPTLDSGARRAGSDNLFSNFRPLDVAPQYRTLPGQSPAWQATASRPAQPAESEKRLNDTIKKSKEAPAPIVEDFPDLGPSQGASSFEPKPATSKKKNKKKQNKNGFLIGDEFIGTPQKSEGSRLKGESNLQSAADLIFTEKKAPKNSKKNVEHKISEEKIILHNNSESKIQIVRPSKEPTAVNKPIQKKDLKKSVETSGEDSFPSLGASSSRISSNFIPASNQLSNPSSSWGAKQAPQKSAPPPGFSAPSKPAAPPGFKSPTVSVVYRYHEPSNFASRNQQLLSLIMSLVGGKSVEFDKFKVLSNRFRNGAVSCSDYHSECLNLIEKSKFEKFLPQLIALLPDISKQQELFQIHRTKFPGSDLGLTKCETCGQILITTDVNEHGKSHQLDDDFPQLSIK